MKKGRWTNEKDKIKEENNEDLTRKMVWAHLEREEGHILIGTTELYRGTREESSWKNEEDLEMVY